LCEGNEEAVPLGLLALVRTLPPRRQLLRASKSKQYFLSKNKNSFINY
jgi:hypothetical protein